MMRTQYKNRWPGYITEQSQSSRTTEKRTNVTGNGKGASGQGQSRGTCFCRHFWSDEKFGRLNIRIARFAGDGMMRYTDDAWVSFQGTG